MLNGIAPTACSHRNGWCGLNDEPILSVFVFLGVVFDLGASKPFSNGAIDVRTARTRSLSGPWCRRSPCTQGFRFSSRSLDLKKQRCQFHPSTEQNISSYMALDSPKAPATSFALPRERQGRKVQRGRHASIDVTGASGSARDIDHVGPDVWQGARRKICGIDHTDKQII